PVLPAAPGDSRMSSPGWSRLFLVLGLAPVAATVSTAQVRTQFGLAGPMRDGVQLVADRWLPAGKGPLAALVFRPPSHRTLPLVRGGALPGRSPAGPVHARLDQRDLGADVPARQRGRARLERDLPAPAAPDHGRGVRATASAVARFPRALHARRLLAADSVR